MKRCREHADDGSEARGCAERKKARPLPVLPFRTSPTSKHVSLFSQNRVLSKPPSLTPAESSEDDSDEELVSPVQSSSYHATASFTHDDDDDDMDIVEPEPPASPLVSPKTCTPTASSVGSSRTYLAPTGAARPAASDLSGRASTPIYAHFPAAQAAVPFHGIGSPVSVINPNQSRHRQVTRWRQPSPISEDIAMESPTDLTNTLFKDLGMSTTPEQTSFPAVAATAAADDGDDMAMATTPRTIHFGPNYGSRRRSDAISHGGEGGSGARAFFSMGYRVDCEKCRQRIPGHYSHVL